MTWVVVLVGGALGSVGLVLVRAGYQAGLLLR